MAQIHGGVQTPTFPSGGDDFQIDKLTTPGAINGRQDLLAFQILADQDATGSK